MTTDNLLDIGFDKQNWKPSEFRAGIKPDVEMVAICTEHNLTDYKMAPPRKGGVQYALLVISSARETQATGAAEPRRKTFQVERIQTIEADDIEAYRKCWQHSHTLAQKSFSLAPNEIEAHGQTSLLRHFRLVKKCDDCLHHLLTPASLIRTPRRPLARPRLIESPTYVDA